MPTQPLALAALLTPLMVAAAPVSLPADLKAQYHALTQAYLKGDPAALKALFAPEAKYTDIGG